MVVCHAGISKQFDTFFFFCQSDHFDLKYLLEDLTFYNKIIILLLIIGLIFSYCFYNNNPN